MLYDVIVTNKETNQAEVVKYLIRFDTMKIKLLRDKLAEHPEQNVELISKLDSLLNYDFRPIFYILSKEELDDDDVILKDCVIINVEMVTPLYAIPGARRIMDDNNKSLDKKVIVTDDKESLYEPILNDNYLVNNNLLVNKNVNKVRKLVPANQE